LFFLFLLISVIEFSKYKTAVNGKRISLHRLFQN